MSNERHPQDDLSDPLVSRTYRDLSDERAPEHLDHLVLNEARRAAKPGYATTISWLRPAAWVTTIGLCLAIVLEVSDMEAPVQPIPGTPVGVEQEPAATGESAVDTPTADRVATPAPAAKSSDAVREQTSQDGKLEQAFMDSRQDQPAALSGRLEEKSAEEASAPGLTNPKRQQPAAIEADSFDQDDRGLLREAENRARMQTGSDRDSVESIQQVAPALGVASDAALERYCEDSETVDPNDWLACILELEQQGLLEAANSERNLLRESFPDAPLLISR
jgi:hypothetical protein